MKWNSPALTGFVVLHLSKETCPTASAAEAIHLQLLNNENYKLPIKYTTTRTFDHKSNHRKG
jgi:hypothetical protein